MKDSKKPGLAIMLGMGKPPKGKPEDDADAIEDGEGGEDEMDGLAASLAEEMMAAVEAKDTDALKEAIRNILKAAD